MTALATRASARVPGPVLTPDFPISKTSSTCSDLAICSAAERRVAARPYSAARTFATISRSRSRTRLTGKDEKLKIPRLEKCDECDGSGAEKGTQPETCITCGGSGQTRYQQGFFSVMRTCPNCQGKGRDHPNAVQEHAADRDASKRNAISKSRSRPVSRPVRGFAWRAKARRASTAVRRATSTSSSTSTNTRILNGREPTFIQPCRHVCPGGARCRDQGQNARRRRGPKDSRPARRPELSFASKITACQTSAAAAKATSLLPSRW